MSEVLFKFILVVGVFGLMAIVCTVQIPDEQVKAISPTIYFCEHVDKNTIEYCDKCFEGIFQDKKTCYLRLQTLAQIKQTK